MLRRSPPLRLFLGRSAIRSELDGSDDALVGRIEFTREEELRAAVGELVGRVSSPVGLREAELLIESPLLQRRQLTDLPSVSRRELRALVEHQASRFFRQNGHRLGTDAHWEARDQDAPPTATAVAVEEHLVEVVMAEARGAGVAVTRVRPASAAGGEKLSLIPQATREARQRAAWDQVRRWSLFVLALWLVVGCIAIIRLEQERRMIERELARLEAPLSSLRAARQKMTHAEVMLWAVELAQRERHLLAHRMRSVTQALPDSSFITTLRLSLDGTGSLSGEAADPFEAVAALERDTLLPPSRLERTPLRDPADAGGWARFAIVIGGRSDAHVP